MAAAGEEEPIVRRIMEIKSSWSGVGGKREKCKSGHVIYFGDEGAVCEKCEFADRAERMLAIDKKRVELYEVDVARASSASVSVAEHSKLLATLYEKMLNAQLEQTKEFGRIATTLEKLVESHLG